MAKSSDLDKLKSIVLDAGKILKDGFYKNKQVEYKGVVDLVTQYDKECEEYLINRLKEEFKDYYLIGEESNNGDFDVKSNKTNKAIYIDPIDGTTNFIHQIPHFAISVGFYEKQKAQLGIVYNPILEEMFWAIDGKGAFKNGSKISVSSQKSLQNSLIATGFPYSKVERGESYYWVMKNLTTLLPYIQDIRRLGSAALDLCYIAEGKLDGFYEIELKSWDVSAGTLILEEAGGKVTNIKGESYTLGEFGILGTNGLIHTELLQHINPNLN